MIKKTINIGAAVLLWKDGKILLGKRLAVAGFGQWGLPGGHIEYGESLKEAALRELKEETGIVLELLNFCCVVNDPQFEKQQHYIHFVFQAETSQEPKVLEPEKCESWQWFNPQKLPEPIFFGHSKLLETALENKVFID